MLEKSSFDIRCLFCNLKNKEWSEETERERGGGGKKNKWEKGGDIHAHISIQLIKTQATNEASLQSQYPYGLLVDLL